MLRRPVARGPARRAVSTEQRTLRLHGVEVSYTLRRSARRTLALQVGAAGVRVSVPLRAADADIDIFLARNAGWLQDALQRLGARAPQAVIEIHDGLLLPLLGDPFRVRARDAWAGAPSGASPQTGWTSCVCPHPRMYCHRPSCVRCVPVRFLGLPVASRSIATASACRCRRCGSPPRARAGAAAAHAAASA